MGKKIFSLLLFCMLTRVVSAQTQADEELAAQYFANKEYAKAADVYEKLLNRKPASMYFYDNLLQCYVQQSQFPEAGKLIKKQIKRFEGNVFFKVDQGYLLRLQKENSKAESAYEELIKKLLPSEEQVFELAKAFEKRSEYEFAIRAYMQGRRILQQNLLFAGELGGLYLHLGNTPMMVEEFLNLLVINSEQEEQVQGLFQNTIQKKEDYDILRESLLKKSRTYPDHIVFPKMIIWMYVQQNDYKLALFYAKMLDKKFREEGRRILELGFWAEANEQYDAAIEIFLSVQALGKDKPFYTLARKEETEVRAKKVLQGNYTQQDLLNLANAYQLILNEFGVNPSTASTMRSLAQLQAFYMDKYEEPVALYQQVIQMPRADRQLVANCKLELADFYIMRGEVWESMLLYGQVDKDFLEEPLGQEAKFRNARLSYYLGEFEWAKAQLDVLKTATTQLISNNALELSLLIQDNTVDSIMEPLEIFAQADLNYVQNHLTRSLFLLDSLQSSYPKHRLTDDILFKKAQIFGKQKDYVQAAKFYAQVVNEHGSDILGDNALYEWAKLNQNQLNNPVEASKLYERFITEYPGSFFLTDCRKQYRKLRGDQIN